MSDITVIMAGSSTSLVLMEFEVSKVVNEILDDAMEYHSLSDDSDCNDD
jgi:hypothetical protein